VGVFFVTWRTYFSLVTHALSCDVIYNGVSLCSVDPPLGGRLLCPLVLPVLVYSTPRTTDALVQEANLAFLLNVNIFQEILDEPLSELPPMLEVETPAKPVGHPPLNGGKPSGECPFLVQSKAKAEVNHSSEVGSIPKKAGTCPVHNPNIMVPIGVLILALLVAIVRWML
jgi:hypothetical protein